MQENIYLDGYENLVAAVIKQAVDDYRKALRRLRKHPSDAAAIRMKEDCERFFERDIEIYSDLDGKFIMQRIQNRVNEEMEE